MIVVSSALKDFIFFFFVIFRFMCCLLRTFVQILSFDLWLRASDRRKDQEAFGPSSTILKNHVLHDESKTLCVCVCVCAYVLSRVRLCSHTDCSPPGSSGRGIFQARIREWVAVSYSRGSSRPWDRTPISWVSWEDSRHLPPEKPW